MNAPRHSFLQRLERSVLLADGAMGTMVQQLSPELPECTEALNLSRPELIRDIHRQYIQAGAALVETNTFAANRPALSRFGMQDRIAEINRAGVRLARQEAGDAVLVAGSIGPLPPSDEDSRPFLREQMNALLEEGVDLLILETFGYLSHLLSALEEARHLCSLPVIASLTLSRQATTYDGFPIEAAADRLIEAGADVLGLNCGFGIQAIEAALRRIPGLKIPISVMPNAGYPERVGGRYMYGVSEAYFASKGVELASLGARLLGGCCGTSPSHIAALRRLLREKKIARRPVRRHLPESIPERGESRPGALLERIGNRRLPIICEIDPPAGLETGGQVEAIAAVAAAGADAVSMADNPLASIRIGNLAFAAHVRQQVDVPIILHATGRDHNLLGLQSFFLGADLLGIEGLLCVTGDPSHAGGPTNVFDVDSVGLIRMAAALCAGRSPQGRTLSRPARFSIGCAVNPNLADPSSQLRKLRRKIESGARFVMTQPLFEKEKILDFVERTREMGAAVYIGVFPVLSSRTAEYLHNEVPGITIPGSFRERLARREDRDYQQAVGMEQARALIAETAGRLDGLYLIAPHGRPLLLRELVEFARQVVPAGVFPGPG